MKSTLKIKLLNILIALCTFLACLCWILSSVMQMFGNENFSTQTDVIISATTNLVEADKPLYNIMSSSSSVSLNRVEILNQTDVINAFYAYFESLQANGGYAYEAYSIVAGTAKVMGISKTAYQASYMYVEVNNNGDYRFENGTAEVAGPDGKATGMGRYQYEIVKQINGSRTKQETQNVSASKMPNGQYKLSPNFNGASASAIDNSPFIFPFMFKLADNTITSCNITKNAFSYNVELTLNEEGYRKIAEHNAQGAGASSLPSLISFKLHLNFDNFGRVLSLSYDEQYSIAVSVPVVGSVNANNVATWVINIYTESYTPRLED